MSDANASLRRPVAPVPRQHRQLWSVLAIVVAWGACSACAARTTRTSSLSELLIKQGEPSVSYGDGQAVDPEAQFREYTRQLRTAQASAVPLAKTTSSASVETASLVLKQLLAALQREPTAAQYRAVAQEYRRLGILDQAYSHLTRALEINPKDATAYDLRARLWRAWDLPQLGLNDANRAVFYAPKSAAAWNTLGTLLHVSGQLDEARRIYGRALSFDGEARYVWANLCRLHRQRGQRDEAVTACGRAAAKPISSRATAPADPILVSDDVTDVLTVSSTVEASAPTTTIPSETVTIIVESPITPDPIDAARLMGARVRDPLRRPVLQGRAQDGQPRDLSPDQAIGERMLPLPGPDLHVSYFGQMSADLLRQRQAAALPVPLMPSAHVDQ